MDKRMFKKTEEELQEYMTFRKRGFIMKNKKGKGSYSRKDKHKNKKYETGRRKTSGPWFLTD